GLPPQLSALYGGGLGFVEPRLYANFVETLDGIVAIPSLERSNALVAGDSEADKFLMGLLRAFADVVLVGSGTMLASPKGRRRARRSSARCSRRASSTSCSSRCRRSSAAALPRVVGSDSSRAWSCSPRCAHHRSSYRCAARATTCSRATRFAERHRFPLIAFRATCRTSAAHRSGTRW